VLKQQGADGAVELAGLAQPREDVAFLQRLVECLDVVVDDQRGVVQMQGRDQPARLEIPGQVAVDEQDPDEQAMLAHEILARRRLRLVAPQLRRRS